MGEITLLDDRVRRAKSLWLDAQSIPVGERLVVGSTLESCKRRKIGMGEFRIHQTEFCWYFGPGRDNRVLVGCNLDNRTLILASDCAENDITTPGLF